MGAADDLLNDQDDPHKRVQAILSLGEIGHLAALDRILSFASDPDPQVRRAVMGALAGFDDNRALAVIIALRGDPDAGVRAAADQTWATWLLKRMLQLSGAERGYVMLKNTATGAMEYQAGEKISAEQVTKPEFAVIQQVIAEAAQTGAPILTDNASRDSRYSGSEGIVGFSLRQLIAVPLKSGDEVVGVVYCDKRFAQGLLKPAELQTLTAFADEAAEAARPTPLPMAPPPDLDDLYGGGMADGLTDDEPAPEPDDFPLPPLPPLISPPAPITPPLDIIEREATPPTEEQPVQRQNTMPPGEAFEEGAAQGEAPEPPGAVVNFSAYHPAEAVAEEQHGLYVYAHLPELAPAVESDVGQFRAQLGGGVPAPRIAKQTARLQPGTLITVTPECDDLEFEPVAVTKKWNGQWTRFDFAFQPGANMAGDSLFVRVSVAVSGVEIAQIKCPIAVIAQPDNPLRAAKLTAQTATLYQHIFVSYSRKDKPVAEAYRLAQMALGNEIFMDSYSIRVGDDWRAALARAIDDSDIFQLFWSNAAAESENVRDEWDYALKYRCPDQTCATFIRPVFWSTPMPPPPDALAHLNFRFVPLDAAGSQS